MTSHLLKAIVICLFCCISASFALSEIEQTALNKILEVWPNLKNPALFQPAWSSNPSNACDKDPWSGITCDVQGNVIGLTFENKPLNGYIPNAIKDLENLSFLILSNTNVSGSIPSTIGQLTKLRRLQLIQNNLNGFIPASISNLSQLQYLNLSLNHINLCNNDLKSLPKSLSVETCDITQQHVISCGCTVDKTLSNCLFDRFLPICPSVEVCPGTRPSPAFQCSKGVWTSPSSVESSTLRISSHVEIQGNLTVSQLIFEGLSGFVKVNGCISMNGSISISLKTTDLDILTKKKISSEELRRTLFTQTSMCPSNHTAPIKLIQPAYCKKASVNPDKIDISTSERLTVTFAVESKKCDLLWIVPLSVLAGIIVGSAVISFILGRIFRPKPEYY